MNEEKGVIAQTYRDYVTAFQSLDPKAVLPYFHAPFISISNRQVRVMPTPKDIEESFSGNMEILKQNNYARTDIKELNVRQMSTGLALVSVDLERYTSDGERLGGPDRTYPYTYTLRKVDDNWKIAVAMAHDRESILRFD